MQLLGNSQRRPRASGGEAETGLALDSTGLTGVEKPRVGGLAAAMEATYGSSAAAGPTAPRGADRSDAAGGGLSSGL